MRQRTVNALRKVRLKQICMMCQVLLSLFQRRGIIPYQSLQSCLQCHCCVQSLRLPWTFVGVSHSLPAALYTNIVQAPFFRYPTLSSPFIICLHFSMLGKHWLIYRVFFVLCCLTYMHRFNAPPDAPPALRPTPLVEEVWHSMTGARKNHSFDINL